MKSSELRKFVAPEFVYGEKARLLAGNYVHNLGVEKIMLVSDPGVVRAGWTGEVLDSLRGAGIDCEFFDHVQPNPREEQVMHGADVYKSSGCEAIVAVGGGSPMDCAKGIGIVVSNKQHILDFEGVDNVKVPSPPLICIPTTAGSAADVSQFAIITDSERRVKISIVSKALVPDLALIDPETTTTMDRDLTVATAMDALTHAMEAYVSSARFSITDVHALKAIGFVHGNLEAVVNDPGNIEIRDRIMLACLHAGLAFSNAILGAVHAMAHSLGGYLDFAHGDCNALLLDSVVYYNFAAVPERYRDIAREMGIDTFEKSDHSVRDKLTGEIVRLRQRAGMDKTLSTLGLDAEDIPALARMAMQDACMLTNPRELNVAEVEEIYARAL
ncbi:MAG: alcohol dehydrogenase-like regulatory protein ErcA [Desulfonatronovibrionaceae bacterium]